MTFTTETLRRLYHQTPKELCDTYWLEMNKLFPQYGMFTPRRIAAFLGQVGWESNCLKDDEEKRSTWNTTDPKDRSYQTGDRYENRKALGNYVPGDGPRFIGRGIIQLTGRYNYTKYGQLVGVDLIKAPEKAKEPAVSTRIALEYWKDKGLNRHADAWNIDAITKAINGGLMNNHHRKHMCERALKLLEGTTDEKQ